MTTLSLTRRAAPRSPLPVLLAGAFMVVLDFFIVNVALPSIADGLGAGDTDLEWVVAAYGLAFAALLVAGARLGDRFGRRRVYMLGLAGFTAASAACGLAPTSQALVVARVLQGATGAIAMPQVLAIIGATYPGAERTRAMTAYGIALGIAAVGGQVIGGALLAAGLGWRACFALNVPIGLAALALAPAAVPESRGQAGARIDVRGTLLLGASLVALLLPLVEGRRAGWPLWTWLSLAAGAVLAAEFVVHQRALAARGGSPLLDLGLFRTRSFTAALVTQLALAGVQAAFFVYLAIYLQQGRGLSPLAAGGVFAILAAAYVAASGPATRATARHARGVVAGGGACLVAGFAATAAAVGGSTILLVPGLVLVGLGIGCAFTPLAFVALSEVAPERSGGASGAMSTTQQVGYAAGVAITGLIFFGQAHAGLTHAFELSLVQLTFFAGLIVAASRLIRAR